MRLRAAPRALAAALLTLLLHVLQPSLIVGDIARAAVSADAASVEGFCGLQHAPDGQDDSGKQVAHCRICHACCTGYVTLTTDSVLHVPAV